MGENISSISGARVRPTIVRLGDESDELRSVVIELRDVVIGWSCGVVRSDLPPKDQIEISVLLEHFQDILPIEVFHVVLAVPPMNDVKICPVICIYHVPRLFVVLESNDRFHLETDN